MRTERLLQLLAALQASPSSTAAQLAADHGVSVRTIYRDLETLSAAGFPVVTERGPGGGCALLPGFRSPVTALSGEEADALALAGLPGAAAELGFGALLAAGQKKLLAALPPRVRETAARTAQRFYLDPTDWFRPAPDHPALPALARAVWTNSWVDLDYTRGNGEAVSRRVAPLGLVLKAGRWYLAAQVDGAGRVYRVSRVREAIVTDETFDRDRHFELGSFWTDWVRDFEEGLPRFPALLRLSPKGQRMTFLLGDAVRRAPASPAATLEADGWQRRPVTFEHEEHAISGVLSMAGEAEVIEPEALRTRIEEISSRLTAQHAAR